jgi:hypothetical protein
VNSYAKTPAFRRDWDQIYSYWDLTSFSTSLNTSQPNEYKVETEGGCACGRISYHVDGELSRVDWCYCRTCQRQSGSAFLPFASFQPASISWIQQPDIMASSTIAKRYFCKDCGSVMGMSYDFQPDEIGITCGTVEGPVPPPSAHIFLKDKPSWFTVPDDGAKRQETFSDGFLKRLSEWKRGKGIADEEELY